MKVDPRFVLSTETADGRTRLRLAAASAMTTGEVETRLMELSLDEVLGLAGSPGLASFHDRKALHVLEIGWQSWSFGGETPVDRPRRRSFRAVDVLTRSYRRPATPQPRASILSHFIMGLRSGENYLVLASTGNPGPSGRGRAPLSFRLGRRDLSVAIEAYAEGAAYAAGEVVAELEAFHAEGYFAAKDRLREVYAGYRSFDRLSFLGKGLPTGARGAAGGAAADGSGAATAARLIPGGYESWYNHYTHIDEKLILGDLEGLGSGPNLINEYYLRRGKPTVFQVDDGWEKAVGDWEADPVKFPGGMKATAERIEARGLIPGLWLAPFIAQNGAAVVREHPDWVLRTRKGKPVVCGYNNGWDGDYYALDISRPEVEDYLVRLFETVVEDWGYRYLKLDFLFAGLMRGERAGGGAAFEHYERLVRRITSRTVDRKGRPVAWLGCGAPFEASFRHFPLMRIGADTRESWDWDLLRRLGLEGRPSAWVNLRHTIGKSILDGTVFVADPDVVFCREKGMGYGEREKELVALVALLFASQIMFSDDTHEAPTASEAAFTARIIALYDRLADREYRAGRLAADVFEVESRDGKVRGLVNLSGSTFSLAASRFPGEAVVAHADRVGAELVFEPCSISLYEV